MFYYYSHYINSYKARIGDTGNNVKEFNTLEEIITELFSDISDNIMSIRDGEIILKEIEMEDFDNVGSGGSIIITDESGVIVSYLETDISSSICFYGDSEKKIYDLITGMYFDYLIENKDEEKIDFIDKKLLKNHIKEPGVLDKLVDKKTYNLLDDSTKSYIIEELIENYEEKYHELVFKLFEFEDPNVFIEYYLNIEVNALEYSIMNGLDEDIIELLITKGGIVKNEVIDEIFGFMSDDTMKFLIKKGGKIWDKIYEHIKEDIDTCSDDIKQILSGDF